MGREGPLGPGRGSSLVPGAVEAAAVFDAASPRGAPAHGTAEDERRAYAVLASVHGLGPLTLARLVGAFGSARAVVVGASTGPGRARIVEAAQACQRQAGRVPDDLPGAIARAAAHERRLCVTLRQSDVEVLTLDDERYPRRLRGIELPPPVLFVRGSIDALDAPRAVAVVGTRRPTEDGRRIASRIGAALARSGATVVSGLAVGIDGAAHAAVVTARRPTIAVLGGGHGHLYPAAHRNLANRIVEAGGAVISELTPDVAPARGMFPRRNRVISGLSEATVVVEAGLRSGALITAAWALEQGRGCFLVPGSLDAPTSAGCLEFLRECPGEARIVTGVPELLVDLGLGPATGAPVRGGRTRRTGSASTGPSAEAILAEFGPAPQAVGRALVAGRTTADAIVAGTGLAVATVLAAITLLEMAGLVVGAYGHYRPAGRLAAAPAPRRRRDHRPGLPRDD